MHNFVYQLLHPWHWLTYGQNAAGLGIVGLFFYTLYTRRMMLIGQDTRRAELRPYLVLESEQRVSGYANVTIANVGASAVNLHSYSTFPPAHLVLGNTYIRSSNNSSLDRRGSLLSGQTYLLKFIEQPGQSQLIIVDCFDLTGGHHQFRIVRDLDPQAQQVRIKTHMLNSLTYVSPWRRIKARVNRVFAREAPRVNPWES